MPIKRPCNVCGTLRLVGGRSQPGPCRRCFLKHKREARAAARAQYRCKSGCGRQVSGDDTNCRHCHFKRRKSIAGHVRPLTQAERDSLIPTQSWWICPRDQWGQQIAEQMPRLAKVPVERERNRDMFALGN